MRKSLSNWRWLIQWCLIAVTSVLVTVSCRGNLDRQTPLPAANSTDVSCRTVPHLMGETCVPTHPEHVVTLSTTSLANALVLGVKPIGSATPFDSTEKFPSYLQSKIEGIKPLGTEEQPSIEAIALIKPDVIIGWRSHEAIYSQLSNIAPTVLYDWQSDETWRDQFSFETEALSRQEAAEQAWDRYNQRIEELKRALGNRYQNKTFSFIFFYFGRLGSDIKNSFAGSILNDVGLQRPPSQDVVVPYGSIDFSEELLEKADGDFLFVTTFTDNDEENLQQLLQKPLWRQLKAVQQNHVYFVNSHTWIGWNLLAADAVIDDLFTYLVNNNS